MISTADFQKIKALIFDIDGTLTDGTYGYSNDGHTIKFFNMQDQHWLKLAIRAGLMTAFLSGRDDMSSRRFAEDAKVTTAVFGAANKLNAYELLLNKLGVSHEETLYVGDDVVDMPVLKRAGIAVIPANAVSVLDEVAQWRTHAAGGKGVAQEIIQRVLQEQNQYDTILERYRK